MNLDFKVIVSFLRFRKCFFSKLTVYNFNFNLCNFRKINIDYLYDNIIFFNFLKNLGEDQL